MKRLLVAAGLLGLAAVPGLAQDKMYSNSYKGKAPPEISARGEHFVNTQKKTDLSLEDLRGRVVYLEFSFLH